RSSSSSPNIPPTRSQKSPHQSRYGQSLAGTYSSRNNSVVAYVPFGLQPSSSTSPEYGSTRYSNTPAGMLHSGTARSSYVARMMRPNTGAAKPPPVAARPSGVGLSYPIHTAPTISGVYPTNHASVALFVVPVLPATGPRKPAVRTPVPVP